TALITTLCTGLSKKCLPPTHVYTHNSLVWQGKLA
ncbi:MAG: hypothetical protein ACJAXU_001072, partial [Paracoccaceae bacterium]